MCKRRFYTFLSLVLAAALSAPADATWSIVVANRVTKEIAVASATCVSNTNLLRRLPVVRVDVGAAAAQALVDGSGRNRNIIWSELQVGTDPATLLQILADGDAFHQSRQYGIVDSQGRSITFTGSRDGPFADGVTGQFGDFSYAIQGNVLTGMPVIAMAEAALRDTPGGLPEKLMAAMEAARSMGGDGRCSCDNLHPDSCGSPPPDFRRSAFVGFMVVTRRGDTDGGPCRNGGSCAGGNYYLKLNARNPPRSDPVPRLRTMFDEWRVGLVGIPDAVESVATLSTNHLPNNGAASATLSIDLRDWQAAPATELTGLSIDHDPRGSAGSVSIGPISDLGGGVF